MSISVMIIEDEGMTSELMALQLEDAGYDVCAIHTTAEAALTDLCERAEQETLPDVIFTDIRLAGKLNGVEAAVTIHELYHKFIVFVSSVQESSIVNSAKSIAQSAFMPKPFNVVQAEGLLKSVSLG